MFLFSTFQQGWQSYRTFFQKNRIKTHKKIACCLLPTVLYLVVSCDCFVIILFPGKEKFDFGYDLLHHSAFLLST